MLQKKFVISLALIASLAFTAGCSSAAESDPAAVSSSAAAPASAPTPDLAGVPEIVATVNGEEITKADFTRIYETQFAQVQQQAQSSGQELDQAQLRKQTAEGLVNTELLIQEAAKKKIFATDKDLDAALADVAKSNAVSTKEFLSTMKSQGLDEDAVRLQLKTQLEVERLIAKEIGDFKPSEKDLKAAYKVVEEQYAAQGATDAAAAKAPSYKEIKSELSQQLKLQKESASVKKYAAQLRKTAKITTNM
ncbi:MAG: SurA N-terminal domain-containing protein [Paeniglutamicibacter terrestris]